MKIKNPFKSYKAEFDIACKVMESMTEEIIRLREVNEDLRKDNSFLHAQVKKKSAEIDALKEENAQLCEDIEAARLYLDDAMTKK